LFEGFGRFGVSWEKARRPLKPRCAADCACRREPEYSRRYTGAETRLNGTLENAAALVEAGASAIVVAILEFGATKERWDFGQKIAKFSSVHLGSDTRP
jgi:hypothetical protein